MKVKRISPDDTRWNEFCLESDDCWFFHTLDYMEYILEYGGTDSEMLSFYIEDGNKDILALCPLIRHKDKLLFSGATGPNPALRNRLSEPLSKKLLRQIFFEIDNIAKERNLIECEMSLTPLAKNNLTPYTYNYLMKYGFENISLNTQILDLEKDLSTLWGDIKKSHRNAIKKGLETFNFFISKPFENDINTFKNLKNLHYIAAGRKTRSDRTWEIQYNWKLNGNYIIIIAFLDDTPVGGIGTTIYKNCAFYGLSANHPDYEQYQISHSVQWELIKWLKYNRFKYYELGIQQFSDQIYDKPTQKYINISLFKRHFGGYTITYHRGLKRYKKNN